MTAADAASQLDEICDALQQVGLMLEEGKSDQSAKTKDQSVNYGGASPTHLTTPQGLVVAVFGPTNGRDVYMLSTEQGHSTDIDFHPTVCLQHRLRYFHAVVSRVACYATGLQKILRDDLRKLDLVFRCLLGSVVGAPGQMDWTRPWHEILYTFDHICGADVYGNKCSSAQQHP